MFKWSYCNGRELDWTCTRVNQPAVEGHCARLPAVCDVGCRPLVTLIVRLRRQLWSLTLTQSENSCKKKKAVFKCVKCGRCICVVQTCVCAGTQTHTHTHRYASVRVHLLRLCWCFLCKWPELPPPLSGNTLSDKCFVGAPSATWCVRLWLAFNISWHLIHLICFFQIQKNLQLLFLWSRPLLRSVLIILDL